MNDLQSLLKAYNSVALGGGARSNSHTNAMITLARRKPRDPPPKPLGPRPP